MQKLQNWERTVVIWFDIKDGDDNLLLVTLKHLFI